jgi:hypothetical protein
VIRIASPSVSVESVPPQNWNSNGVWIPNADRKKDGWRGLERGLAGTYEMTNCGHLHSSSTWYLMEGAFLGNLTLANLPTAILFALENTLTCPTTGLDLDCPCSHTRVHRHIQRRFSWFPFSSTYKHSSTPLSRGCFLAPHLPSPRMR